MIYLAQTDTTVGFLSESEALLNQAKNRPANTPCMLTTARLSELKNFAHVPAKFKNLVRRAKKTTFIYPNSKSVRYVQGCEHAKFLYEFGAMYSSSANLHGAKFDEQIARSIADVIVDEHFSENPPSKIYKISNLKIKKIR